jgi:hypothetical protein
MTVGLGAGLVAYYTGLPTSAVGPLGGPDELKYVGRNASLLAYADVGDIMASDVRQRLLKVLSPGSDGRREFQEHTGINVETDVDRVVVAVAPPTEAGGPLPGSALVIASGRFDAVRIEALMREHGARVEDYKGVRLIVADELAAPTGDPAPVEPVEPRRRPSLSLAFVEPGVVVVGHSSLVRGAIDLKDGGDSVALNDEMMTLVRSLERDSAWVVGRFDVLASQAQLPADMASRLPAITWVSASVDVNGGVRGVLRAEARDETSATNLRDVMRGFLALAKMQTSSQPALQAALQSLELTGAGTTVALAFDLPAELFDLIGSLERAPQPAQ